MRLFCPELFVSFAILFTGCAPRAVSPSPSSAKAGPTSDDVLTSALYQLKPENFGINSDMEKAASLLNAWRFKQADQQRALNDSYPVAAPPGWITEGDETRLAQSKFDLEDAVHIRDAILFHTIAGYVSDRGRTERQRVNAVVDFVCRNVALWKDDELELPMTPYLTLQVGHGTADDRAWVCSAVLRQLRLDSVIVRAKADTKESTDKWLLGVGVEGNVHLYDMRLGLPLSNADGTSAATLAEIQSHPEWLREMSAGEPYRLTADDFQDPAIFVMPDPPCWCHRMRNLELVLPAGDACVIYDPLMESEGNPGMLRRISEANHWPVENLKRWRYPLRQTEAMKNPTKEAHQEMSKLLIPLSVPIPFKMTEDGKVAIGTPERRLERVRIDQLLGRFADAITRYLRIRHLEVERFPPDLERLNRLAVEDAFYWTALCKFESGDYEGAVSQLTDFLKKYDRKGNWYFPARTLLAQCRIELGQIPEAIAVLERTSSDDPDREGNAIRLKRLRSKKP